MRQEPAGPKGACERIRYAANNPIAGAGNRVGRQTTLNAPVDPCGAKGYRNAHIRPLVVGLLDHPERVPRPWGFSISGAAETDGAWS